jgi:5'-methylthioadenosine phosphorylase
MVNERIDLAVIGGSGLYSMPDIGDIQKVDIPTPFGAPSSQIAIGTVAGKRVAFLARHGDGHVFPPSAIPQRANIYALKTLGVKYIIGVNACGSLREDYAPSHLVVPDQLFDYNIGRRDRSFFDDGIVAHVSVAEPFDATLSQQLHVSAQAIGATAHLGGTFLIEDGPRFATRGESLIFKQWGCSIIGMTTAPEAFLAREAEIAYATLAHITDYDSWHETEESVTVEMVMATFKHNIESVQKALIHAITHFDATQSAPAHTALNGAIMTAKSKLSADKVKELQPILARVMNL